MSQQVPPSIAFIGWNPFQFRHVLNVARHLKNAAFIIEKRRDHIFHFTKDFLTATDLPIIIWHQKQVKKLDGFFDIIVCQTPFSQMEQIQKSKIAMIQYGYAKEPHNYGKWRSAASLCLVYGNYAARKISPMCPVSITGNPSLDSWHEEDFHHFAQLRYGTELDSNKKTILYAPTWGELSTTQHYLNEILTLSREFNVLLKLHHNTDLLEKKKRTDLKAVAPIVFGASDDLLALFSLSDIVLSDYSGAIFDALYCEKPVILLHDQKEKRVDAKLSLQSLEYAGRHRIGPVLEKSGNLRQTIMDVLDKKIDFTEANRELVHDLYLAGPDSADRAATALRNLALQIPND